MHSRTNKKFRFGDNIYRGRRDPRFVIRHNVLGEKNCHCVKKSWERVWKKKRKGGNFPSHRITNDPPRVKFNASSKQKRGRLGAGSSLLTPVAAKRRVMKFAVVFSQRRNRSLSVPFSFSPLLPPSFLLVRRNLSGHESIIARNFAFS